MIKILFLQKLNTLLRLVEHHDWVIFCLVGIVLSYIIMFKTLHRDISLVRFISQKYEDANNIVLSWFIITILFCLSFSVLFSQYIPVVPSFINEMLTITGFQLNKIGFIFITLLVFYFIKNIITYLFFGSVGHLKNFSAYAYVSQKYYLLNSIVLIIISLLHYYLPFEEQLAFNFYLVIILVSFILKNFIYLLNNQQILPYEWYYKFLYICTLQILPILVVWKFLFL